jgi:hypothetical protein
VIKFCSAFLLIFLSIKTFAGEPLAIIKSDLENVSDECWFNTNLKTDSLGNHYSSTDSLNQYGFGYRCSFPVECQNKNLQLIVSEKIRMSIVTHEFGIVCAISMGDSTIVWDFFKSALSGPADNKWISLENKIKIPRNLTSLDFTLSIYLWNNDRNATVDMDDLSIRFEELPMPSYLPTVPKWKNRPDKYNEGIRLNNVNIWLNKKDGGMFIEDKNEDTLFSSIALVTELPKKGKKNTAWQNKWTAVMDSADLLSGISRFTTKSKVSHSILSVNVGTAGKINFNLRTIFDKPVTVSRHALMIGYSWGLKTVINNSIRINNNFANEYWLGKDGFILERRDTNMLIYHQKNISSVQLNTAGKKFIVNADYNYDHPMLHFPLMDKSYGKFVDYSNSVIKVGDTVTCEFTIELINSTNEIPILLPSPEGFQSTFVWTEHADYADMKTNKAVYLGSDRISNVDSATGGFIYHQIPVTKSVFYSNAVPVDNEIKAGFLKGPELTIKESNEFRLQLQKFFRKGIEICLHTPDHYTCDRKTLDEALGNTKRDFSSVTWIDHGYDNAETSNREDLNCDGLDSTSKFYSADLWKRYGIKYLWNSFYEDSTIYAAYAYNSFFSVPYAGWSESMPVPLYWQHKSRSDSFYHWRTTNTMDPADGSLWSYWFDRVRLNDAVKNRSSVIIHCYPSRVDSTTGFYDYKDGEVSVNKGFDDVLQRLSDYREEGKIGLYTLKEFLDFRTSCENLSYEFPGNGIVRIHNTGTTPVFGATFSCIATELKSSKKEVKKKKLGDELIFWFDVEADETIDLLFK